jgi:hypothetical protein
MGAGGLFFAKVLKGSLRSEETGRKMGGRKKGVDEVGTG